MADGPAVWGAPVRSNRGGVYLVELPEPAASAPIDFNAVGRWIERVPTLTLDGAPPTGRELAARLRSFWLPGQPILYIGTSGVSIGARISASLRTPLGDRRPYAGGHWLRTLSGLDRLRIWWAETEAVEEYEDALLEAFAAAVPSPVSAALHDRAVVLPYANLQAADGTRKAHGIAGSLLADEAAGPVTDVERRAAAGRAQAARASGGSAGRAATEGRSDPTRNTGVLRSRSVLTAGGRSAAPRSPRATSYAGPSAGRQVGGAGRQTVSRTAAPTTGSKAPKAPTRLSEDGLAALRAELDELTTVTRPAIVARIAAARELGDLKENSDYHEARREQSFAEGRVRAIEELLRNVEIIEEGADGGRARLGSTVAVVGPDGEEETYTLVGSSEANAAAGRISAESPIGAALMNAAGGDEVEVVIPAGRLRYRVIEVR